MHALLTGWNTYRGIEQGVIAASGWIEERAGTTKRSGEALQCIEGRETTKKVNKACLTPNRPWI